MGHALLVSAVPPNSNEGVEMAGKDKGQKSVKKPATQTLKEKRAAKKAK